MLAKATGPPKGIYFNFLGFCVGAFRMRKRGNDLQIVRDVEEHVRPPKKYRRRRKNRRIEDALGGDVGNREERVFLPDSKHSSASSTVDVHTTAEETDALLPPEPTASSSGSKISSGGTFSADPPTVNLSGAIPPAVGPAPDPDLDDFLPQHASITDLESGVGGYESDEWETDSEHEREMEATMKEKKNKADATNVAGAQTNSDAGAGIGPIATAVLVALLILAPLVCFITFGIISLVEERDTCPAPSWLWIYGITFMFIFFITPFIVPSYKYGAIVWTILFIIQSFIIYYPNVVCQELTHTNLYIWAQWTYWILFAHILISIVVFIIQIVSEQNVRNADGTIKEAATVVENMPLVQGRNRVAAPTVTVA